MTPTAFPLLGLLMLAGCASAMTPTTDVAPEETLGPGPGMERSVLEPDVAKVIQAASEILQRQVVPRPGDRAAGLGEFLVVSPPRALSGAEARRLRSALAEPGSFLAPAAAPVCPTRPEMLVDFIAGNETVSMAASLTCGAVSFYRDRDWRRPVRVLYLDPRVADLRDILETGDKSADLRKPPSRG
jgi:hypothetical protein